MRENRLLFGSIAATAALACTSATALAQNAVFPQQVAAGDVGKDSAVVWAHASHPGLVLFQLDTDANFQWPWRLGVAWVSDPDEPVQVRFRHLQQGTRYHYRALRFGATSATGTFRTAHAGAAAHGLRFGASGDWRGELAPYPAVANAGAQLDFFVALGDTIYADYPSPSLPQPQALTLDDYRIKQAEVYSERYGLNTLADLRGSTAWFATIDDHEVTNDFAGGASPTSDPRFLPSNAPYINETQLYRNGLRAFRDYTPLRDTDWYGTGDARLDGKPKLYRTQRYGNDAAIFVLDARSFRDQQLAPVLDPNDPAQVTQFLVQSFDPTRTMLGQAQVQQLLADLSAADAAGVVWKFVFVPEPIQNLGVLAASDRFEGYAAERTRLLDHITQNDIDNVVFVTADLHGTLVNNLTYQQGPGQPQIATSAWEIITGSVAFDAPLGPTLVELAAQIGLLTPQQVAFYQSLPTPAKDAFISQLIDGSITPLGYDPMGLDGSQIPATLLVGGYVASHSFGWTEFDIDAQTRELTVTTWGIDPYTEADLQTNPQNVVSRMPQIVQQFVVQPQ